MENSIEGVMPVIITPFDGDGNISWPELRTQIDHLVSVGCDGVVVGQVSELLRFTADERIRLAEELSAAADGRFTTVMSTGGESIKDAVGYSVKADKAGCDALLVMHPSIMAINDEQMLTYYRSVIEAVECPILVHHAKSMAKRPLSIEVQAKLLEIYGSEKVMFKPEAAPTPPKVSELMDATGNKAKIFEGDGGMMLADTYQRGVVGVIPATEIAEIVVHLWKLLKQGDDEQARSISYPLSYLMCHMMNSIDCYLAISKSFLQKRKILSSTHIRPPIDYTVDCQTMDEVTKVYNHLLFKCRIDPI